MFSLFFKISILYVKRKFDLIDIVYRFFERMVSEHNVYCSLLLQVQVCFLC